ncbi:MAG TPA: hypothetical protein VMU17_05715, partial [Elusimicrobiota bacterium]|nr:hypothetical protein [Elusimicrobiota bacterium]
PNDDGTWNFFRLVDQWIPGTNVPQKARLVDTQGVVAETHTATGRFDANGNREIEIRPQEGYGLSPHLAYYETDNPLARKVYETWQGWRGDYTYYEASKLIDESFLSFSGKAVRRAKTQAIVQTTDIPAPQDYVKGLGWSPKARVIPSVVVTSNGSTFIEYRRQLDPLARAPAKFREGRWDVIQQWEGYTLIPRVTRELDGFGNIARTFIRTGFIDPFGYEEVLVLFPDFPADPLLNRLNDSRSPPNFAEMRNRTIEENQRDLPENQYYLQYYLPADPAERIGREYDPRYPSDTWYFWSLEQMRAISTNPAARSRLPVRAHGRQAWFYDGADAAQRNRGAFLKLDFPNDPAMPIDRVPMTLISSKDGRAFMVYRYEKSGRSRNIAEGAREPSFPVNVYSVHHSRNALNADDPKQNSLAFVSFTGGGQIYLELNHGPRGENPTKLYYEDRQASFSTEVEDVSADEALSTRPLSQEKMKSIFVVEGLLENGKPKIGWSRVWELPVEDSIEATIGRFFQQRSSAGYPSADYHNGRRPVGQSDRYIRQEFAEPANVWWWVPHARWARNILLNTPISYPFRWMGIIPSRSEFPALAEVKTAEDMIFRAPIPFKAGTDLEIQVLASKGVPQIGLELIGSAAQAVLPGDVNQMRIVKLRGLDANGAGVVRVPITDNRMIHELIVRYGERIGSTPDAQLKIGNIKLLNRETAPPAVPQAPTGEAPQSRPSGHSGRLRGLAWIGLLALGAHALGLVGQMSAAQTSTGQNVAMLAASHISGGMIGAGIIAAGIAVGVLAYTRTRRQAPRFASRLGASIVLASVLAAGTFRIGLVGRARQAMDPVVRTAISLMQGKAPRPQASNVAAQPAAPTVAPASQLPRPSPDQVMIQPEPGQDLRQFANPNPETVQPSQWRRIYRGIRLPATLLEKWTWGYSAAIVAFLIMVMGILNPLRWLAFWTVNHPVRRLARAIRNAIGGAASRLRGRNRPAGTGGASGGNAPHPPSLEEQARRRVETLQKDLDQLIDSVNHAPADQAFAELIDGLNHTASLRETAARLRWISQSPVLSGKLTSEHILGVLREMRAQIREAAFDNAGEVSNRLVNLLEDEAYRLIVDEYFAKYQPWAYSDNVQRLIGLQQVLQGGWTGSSEASIRSGNFLSNDMITLLRDLVNSPEVAKVDPNKTMIGSAMASTIDRYLELAGHRGELTSQDLRAAFDETWPPELANFRLNAGQVLQELIGGDNNFLITTETHKEIIVSDILNRLRESRDFPRRGRRGKANDGIYVPFRERGGWVELPMEEYILGDIMAHTIRLQRPMVMRRITQRAQEMVAENRANAPRVQEMARNVDHFWAELVKEQTWFLIGKMVKTQNVPYRRGLTPRDVDRLFKVFEDPLAGLRVTPSALADCLTESWIELNQFMERAVVDLRVRAESAPTATEQQELRTAATDIAARLKALNDRGGVSGLAKILDGIKPGAPMEDVYRVLSEKLLPAISALDANVFFKLPAPYGFTNGPLAPGGQIFSLRGRFYQTLVDKHLLPYVKRERAYFNIKQLLYPTSLWKMFVKVIQRMADYRSYNVTPGIDRAKLKWGMSTLWLLIFGWLSYSAFMFVMLFTRTFPELLNLVGLPNFPQNLMALFPSLVLALTFSALSFWSFLTWRYHATNKVLERKTRREEVRTMGDVLITIQQLKGKAPPGSARAKQDARQNLMSILWAGLIIAQSFVKAPITWAAVLTKDWSVLPSPRTLSRVLSYVTGGMIVWRSIAHSTDTWIASMHLLLGDIGFWMLIGSLAVWIGFRIYREIVLRADFSLKNYGGNRDEAQRNFRNLIDDLYAKKKLTDEERQKWLNFDIDVRDLYGLLHRAPEDYARLMRVMDTFYRTDMPETAPGRVTPWKDWDAIPKIMVQMTVMVPRKVTIDELVANDFAKNKFAYEYSEYDYDNERTLSHKKVPNPENPNDLPAVQLVAQRTYAQILINHSRYRNEWVEFVRRLATDPLSPELALAQRLGRPYLLTPAEVKLVLSGPHWQLESPDSWKALLASLGAGLTDAQAAALRAAFSNSVEEFINDRLSLQERWVREISRAREMMADYAESYFPDEIYEQLKKQAFDGRWASDEEHQWGENYIKAKRQHYLDLADEKLDFSIGWPASTSVGPNNMGPTNRTNYAHEIHRNLPKARLMDIQSEQVVRPVKDAVWMLTQRHAGRMTIYLDVSNWMFIEELRWLPFASAKIYQENGLSALILSLMVSDRLTTGQRALGTAETTWSNAVQPAADAIGSITEYGKILGDQDAFRGTWLPSLNDQPLVNDDGEVIEEPGGSPNTVRGPSAADKIMTTLLSSFYLKKPLVRFANAMFVVLILTLNIDPWYHMILPWAFVYFTYVHNQAGSAPLISMRNQQLGFPWGMIRWLIMLPTVLFAYFTALLPVYDVAVREKGLLGIAEFPPTMRDGWHVHRPWIQVWRENRGGIRMALALWPF